MPREKFQQGVAKYPFEIIEGTSYGRENIRNVNFGTKIGL